MDLSERAESERKLRESEARFRQLAESMPQLVWTALPDGTVDYCNSTARSGSGAERDASGGLDWTSGIHEDDLAATLEAWNRAVADGVEYQCSHRIQTVDGGFRWHLSRAQPVRDESGAITRWCGIATDIHDLSAAQTALRESERRASNIIESISDGFITLDADWRVIYLNKKGSEILRPLLPVGPVVGEVFWELFPGIAETIFGEAYRRAVREQAPVNVEAYYAPLDGWFDVRCYPMAAGLAVHFLDVTQRRRAETALRESEQRFRDLADNISQLAWMADGSGSIFWFNQRWFDFTGTTLDAMEGWGWRAVHHPDHVGRVVEKLSASFANGTPWEDTFPLRGRDGAYRWFLSRALPIRDASGAVVRWFGTNTDITEQRAAEERLRESQQRQRLAARAAGLGIFEWRAVEGVTVWENERMFEIFGRAPEDGPIDFEHIVRQAVEPVDREAFEHALEEARRPGGALHVVCRIRRGSDRDQRWLDVAGLFDFDCRGAPVRLVGVVADITERKRAEEHRSLLVNELNHRVKNTLSIVQSIAHQTLRSDRSADEQRETLEGRLMALAAAHDVLTRESWEKASLHDLIRRTLVACGADFERCVIDGPALTLPPKQAVTMAMALHELCTNAIKYGALARCDGRLTVEWSIAGQKPRELRFVWRERGGPPVAPPAREGFGMRLLKRALATEFRGSVMLDFDPEGLTCTIAARLPAGPAG